MNELIFNNQKTITSREIAEITGKRHADTMEAIRVMEQAWVKIGQRNFTLTYYTDQWNRQQPQYQLNKTECLYIATKFNDEARAKLILRWEELERQNNAQSIPQSLPEALRLAADLAERVETQNKKLAEVRPLVVFAKAVSESSNSILIRELAKLIAQNGIDIGQDRLFDWMVSNNFLIRKKRYNANKNTTSYEYEPTQYSIKRGVLETVERVIGNPVIGTFTAYTVKVTGKGQTYFINRVMRDFFSNSEQLVSNF